MKLNWKVAPVRGVSHHSGMLKWRGGQIRFIVREATMDLTSDLCAAELGHASIFPFQEANLISLPHPSYLFHQSIISACNRMLGLWTYIICAH